MADKIERRQFIAGAAGVGLSVLSARSAQRVLGANDRIRLGIIGSGGRGRSLMTSFNKFPQVEFIAVCDAYEPNQNLGLKLSRDGAKATYD